jgi:hypothetical protein
MDANNQATDVAPYKKAAFDQYLTFCALGGMMVSDTGGIDRMTLGEFCEAVHVDEETTRRWKKQTSNFGLLVRQRRSEVFSLARETAAYNRLYLIGMTSLPTGSKEIVNEKTGRTQILRYGNLHNDQRAAVDALKTVLGDAGDLQLPVQRQVHKITGGFLEMMTAAREAGIIEGEVVHATSDTGQTADSGRSSQNTQPLPQQP